MTDVVVERLRLRGDGARRLASVAARSLPAALERAMGDLPDARLPLLTVVLDLDPDQYDDDTLAALWADAIVTELARQGVVARAVGRAAGRPRGSALPGRADDAGVGSAGPAGAAAVAAAARAWLAAGAPRERVPAVLALLASEPVAQGVAEQLGAAPTQALAVAVREAARGGVVPGGTDGDRGGAARDLAAARGGFDPLPTPAGVVPDASSAAAGVAPRALPPGEALALALQGTGATAMLAAAESALSAGIESLDLNATTRAAGLVLLYPWLGDFCRDAESLHPGLDPVEVRRHALGLLADPDGALGDDPLVRWLAGADLEADATPQVVLPDAEAVIAEADALLARFAALLPGFATSSPRFVRDGWILRTGILDLEASPVRLTAGTHPLDVLLSRLPYPLGLLKLPWTAPLTTRFVP